MDDQIFQRREADECVADFDSPGSSDGLPLIFREGKNKIDANSGRGIERGHDHCFSGEILGVGDKTMKFRGFEDVLKTGQAFDSQTQGDINVFRRPGLPIDKDSLAPYDHIGDFILVERGRDFAEESCEHD